MENITTVITALIALIGALLTCYLVPFIRTKLSAEQRKNLYNIVEIACKCADQLVKNGVLDKQYRHDHVINYLNSIGITYDVEEVNEMIESVVLSLPPLLLDEENIDENNTK